MFNWKRYRLFSYPLPNAKNTAYHKLGITPEATATEIREAKSSSTEKLQKQKKKVELKLSIVYEKVEGLQIAYDKLKALRGQGRDVDTNELITLEQHLAELEKKAFVINPNFKELRKQLRNISQEINEINQLNLETPLVREQYDKENPPCALLKLENNDQEIFTEKGRKLALYLLRLEISDFLSSNGEECYHPGDLTRKDFTSDFTYNLILDGEKNDQSK